MRRDTDSAPTDTQDTAAGSDNGRDLLTTMIQSLLAQADTPPREVEGVSEEFCDSKELPACLVPLCLSVVHIQLITLSSARPRPQIIIEPI